MTFHTYQLTWSMNILTPEIEKRIKGSVIDNIRRHRYDLVLKNIPLVLDRLYDSIPDNRRISYGIVHTLDVLTKYLYENLEDHFLFPAAKTIFDEGGEFKNRAVGLGLLSFHGLNDYKDVLPYFRGAAADDFWITREIAAHYFRRIIREHLAGVKPFLVQCAKSPDPNVRRFVGETLRPVAINRWMQKNPGYSLAILRHLFTEKASYPRTSVGNNLSDLARKNPERIYGLVEKLVKAGDKNSYWIAYRACRNLVKGEPQRVMALLGVDEYRYKDRHFKRDARKGN